MTAINTLVGAVSNDVTLQIFLALFAILAVSFL